MIVRQLRLANFRAFEHIELAFEKDLNVIAGVNGLGKSSILHALAALFSRAQPEFTPSREQAIPLTNEDIRHGTLSLDTSAIFTINDYRYHVGIQRIQLDIDQKKSLRRKLRKTRADLSSLSGDANQVRELKEEENRLLILLDEEGDRWNLILEATDDQSTVLSSSKTETEQILFALKNRSDHPQVIYFSPKRQLPGSPRTLPELKTFEVAKAYSFALQDREVDLREFMYWFRVVEAGIGSSNQQGTRILDKLREVVSDFVPAFTNLRVEEKPNLRFVVEKDGVPLALNQLSDGERGLLAVIFDITRRLAIANPTLDDPIADGKAIILIDELELHLHPEWQRQVLRRFREIFQNCQFIVTTHSPQVIGEVESRCLRFLLQEDDKIIPWTPSRSLGLDSSRVLEELMDVKARNAEIDEQLNELSQLIDDEDFERAQQCMDELAKILGHDDPELTRARTLMAFLEDTE